MSFFQKQNKNETNHLFEKSHQRDFGQALANAGLGALFALAQLIWPAAFWWHAFLGAMACVNADTWATELGVLSKSAPRLITTGKIVPKGTSGGISLLGSLAALCGAMFIGLVAWLLGNLAEIWPISIALVPPEGVFLLASLSGFAGALFDSFLGATWQVMYYSQAKQSLTEKKYDRFEDQVANQYVRGLPWLNNDGVNFVSAAFAAGLALGLGIWLI